MHSVHFVLISSLSALVRPGSRSPAAQPPDTCSLCDTYTNANGFKLSAGVWDMIGASPDMIGASPDPVDRSRLCPLTSPKCTVSGFCGFATFHVNCFCTFSYVCVAGGADVRQRRPQPPHAGEDHPGEERAPGGGQPRDTDGISRQCSWVTPHGG